MNSNEKVAMPVWRDKQTPVDAANLNIMCGGINQNGSDIEALSQAMALLNESKFDKVTLEGSELKFYAKEVEKFSITLPTGSGGSGVPGQDGEDGREIELRKGTTHIEWRYVDDSNWTSLVSLEELRGDNGKDGINGITPNIQIGNIETLPPGSKATVTRTGTTEAPIFNFGIPQGQPGGGEGGSVDLSAYQTKRDENLTTTEKEIVAAINEVASDTSQNKEKLSVINVENESASEISLEICDKDSFEWSQKGSMYSLSNGVVSSSEYTKKYAYSKKIEIKANEKYSIGVTSGQALFWDNESNYINNIDLTSTDGSFTTPINAKYIAFNKNEDDWIIPMYSLKLIMRKDKNVTIPFLNLLELNIPDGFISKKKLNPEIQNTIDSVKNNFVGKKGVCFGDSNTEFGTYPEQLGELLGCTVYNCGFGGTRYVRHYSVGNFDFFSMCKLTDAVVSNDFSEQESVIASMSGKYAEHFNTLKSINWQEIDFIILNFGTNDYISYGVALGEKDSTDQYQINGALNHILTDFMTNFPHISIYLLAPIFRGKQKNEGTSDDAIYGAGENTLWMKDIVEAVRLKAIEYHVPFKDLYNEFGMNKHNFSRFLQSDGIHLNDSVGVPRMANIVANFLKSN